MSAYEKLRSRIVQNWFSDLKQETYQSKFRGKAISDDFNALNRNIAPFETEKCGLAI